MLQTIHRLSPGAALGMLAIVSVLTLGNAKPASAQVVIDMPAPKPKPRVVAPPPEAPPEAATPATVLDAPEPPSVRPEPGALALRQYASNRYLPDGRYDRYRNRRPFYPGDFSRSFSLYGLNSPFYVITPFQVQIVQPPPIIIKPPGFGN